MQLVVVLTVLGLMNIVGVGLSTHGGDNHNGARDSNNHGSVEVEQVPAKSRGSLVDVINGASKK